MDTSKLDFCSFENKIKSVQNGDAMISNKMHVFVAMELYDFKQILLMIIAIIL